MHQPDSSETSTENTPEKSLASAASTAPSQGSSAERQYDRMQVDWRFALQCGDPKSPQTFHGRAANISIAGVGLLCDNNIPFRDDARLFLLMPSISFGEKEQIIEVRSRIIYSILSGRAFQIGLKFLEFYGDSKSILAKRINYYPTADDKPKVNKGA
jgi:hypothetical protein